MPVDASQPLRPVFTGRALTVEEVIDQKHTLKESAGCANIHEWAKNLLSLQTHYDDAEKFDLAVQSAKRTTSIVKGRVDALEAMTTARYKSQARDILATIAEKEQQVKDFRLKQEQETAKMKEAREQKLRNKAYEICAKEIVKTDSIPKLELKIKILEEKAKERRDKTEEVDTRLFKRVKQMNDIAEQFVKLQEEVEVEKDHDLAKK